MVICATCGVALPRTGNRGRPRKRCRACVANPSRRPDIAKCATCENYFSVTIKQGPVPAYCSRRCSQRSHSPLVSPPEPRACQECGTTFQPLRSAAVCSDACRVAFAARRQSEAARARCTPYDMECYFCGDTFTVDPYTRRNEPKYCRQLCGQQANRDRRRAKIAGTTTERVDRHLVFERDEYICGICHQPVCRTLRYPDPMSKSLDHIIPISRGGSHTYDNVQCSHLCCNVQAATKRADFELAA